MATKKFSRLVSVTIVVALGASLWWFVDPTRHTTQSHDSNTSDISLRPSTSEPPTSHTTATESASTDRRPIRPLVRVLVRRDDSPFSAARVTATTWNEELVAHVDSTLGVASRVEFIARDQTTGADGSLTLEFPSLPVLVMAMAEESSPSAVILDTAVDEVVLDLEPDAPVRVRVIDERNVPVPGATVIGREDSFNSKFFGDASSVAQRAARSFFQSTTTTDSEGKARVRGLARGSLFLEACAPGKGSDAVGFIPLPTEETIDLVLGDEAVVSGIVVDATTELPLSGVRMTVDRFRGPELAGSSAPVISDEHGEFRIAVVAGRDANFLFSIRDGQTCDAINLGPIAIGESRFVKVRIEEARTFRGRVVDSAKKPIAGAGVWIGQLEPRVALGRLDADANGAFEFRHSSTSGSFRVISIAEGYGLFETQIDPPWPKDFEIVLQSLGGIRGRIVADTYPLVNAKVRVASESAASYRWGSQTVEANPNTGEFDIQGLWPATYFLDAMVDGYAPRRVHAVAVQEGKTAEHDIRIDRGATILGVVRDAQTRAPIANARVSLIDPCENSKDLTHSFSLSVTTDGTGHYQFENVPRALRTGFFVDAEGYARSTTIFDLDPAATRLRRDIELAKPTTVRVSATRPDGSPARNLTAWFESRDGGSSEVVCDDGVAEITGLAAGRAEFVCILTDLDRPEFCGLQRIQTFDVTGEATDLHFDFHCGSSVVARVIGSPELLAGKYFALTARRLDADPPIAVTNLTRQSGNRYAVYGLEPGRWQLRVTTSLLGSKVGAEREIEVEAGQSYELDFPVGCAAVSGVIRDRTGQVIEGAEIAIRLRADPATRENGEVVDSWHRDISKPDGTFRVEGLFPGAQEFEVQARGFGRLEGELPELALDKPNTHDFVLEADCTVRVALVDLAGNRVEDASIEVRRVGSSGEPFVPSEIDSRDRPIVHGASTGTHTLQVRAEGYFPFESRISCVAGEDITVTATLRRPAHLALRVQNAEGQRLRDTPLEIVDSMTQRSISAWLDSGLLTASTGSLVTDERGELHVAGVPEGDYEVRCLGSAAKLSTAPPDSPPEIISVPR